MCGIIAYLGMSSAIEYILAGLALLQNRGYDSAGICTITKEFQLLFHKFASRREISGIQLLEDIQKEHVGHTIGIDSRAARIILITNPIERYDFNTAMFEDIIIDVTMGYTEPPTGITASTFVTQTAIDNSTFVGTSSTTTSQTFNPHNLVFNEIGLFAGSNDLFVGNFTTTVGQVNNFVTQGPNYSTVAGTKSKLMLTHVVFHPVQKSANRSLQIMYTLRIQMGAR